MRVVLGTFTRSAVEAFSGRDIAAGVQTALRHYALRMGSERRASELPPVIGSPSTDRTGADIELSLDPEIQAVLEREARESDGVSVEQIANHAVLIYLADLDRASGREARPLTWV